MANRWENTKITADSYCSHEIKRHLLLERKLMTNLDSILKNRDITLPTKVRLVKAMVFPVVMYACESWNVKKAELQRIDAFELWCWSFFLVCEKLEFLSSLWAPKNWCFWTVVLEFLSSLWEECNCVVVWAFFHCLSLGLDRKLTFSSPVATAAFFKFAGILSTALSSIIF